MTRKKRKLPQKLTRLFKMTPEQLAQRKTSGGGVHKSGAKYRSRSEQKRRALTDQLDNN